MSTAVKLTATCPEWLPLVAAFCETFDFGDLPRLDDALGSGRWNVTPCGTRRDKMEKYILYWVKSQSGHTARQHVRIGSFEAPGGAIGKKVRRNDQTGTLTIGFDDCGRRLMRVSIPPNGFRIVAVQIEMYRGVELPIPVPVKEVQA